MAHTPPKGSLEDLFRHHLLDSEAAAVPPRAHVWEQLDHSLLLAQNEKYRRRLLAYRWAVAASLLLASLAGGGWWHSQWPTRRPGLTQATTAPALPTGAVRSGYAPADPATASQFNQEDALAATTSGINSPATAATIAQPATSAFSSTSRRAFAANSRPDLRRSAVGAGRFGVGLAAGSALDYRASQAETSLATEDGAATEVAMAARSGQPTSADQLRGRLAQLVLPAQAGLPVVRAAATPSPLVPARERQWQFGLAYTASIYQPNIDFTKDLDSYNPALGTSSAELTRSAAAEYRSHLRAGLGQRLSVWASRRLGTSRFSLRTGLEVAESHAQSASTVAFVGEQVADLNYRLPAASPLHTSTHRYRTASVPVEVSYSNPSKPGFSLYGKLGGAFNTLLSVRSEVEGNPEAARTYTLSSINSPYRNFSASVRSGVGMRYQPAGHYWALNVGPVAELGLMSLNLDPIQSFWKQQRPYSFGLEAGLELGRAPKVQ